MIRVAHDIEQRNISTSIVLKNIACACNFPASCTTLCLSSLKIKSQKQGEKNIRTPVKLQYKKLKMHNCIENYTYMHCNRRGEISSFVECRRLFIICLKFT